MYVWTVDTGDWTGYEECERRHMHINGHHTREYCDSATTNKYKRIKTINTIKTE